MPICFLDRHTFAASRPTVHTKAQWQSAVVSGLISKGVGTFTNVSSGITERGRPGGSGSQTANAFSLQLNTQFIPGDPACARASVPANCQAWQQFVYTYESRHRRRDLHAALGTEASPTMATRQTNGTIGTASCAVAG